MRTRALLFLSTVILSLSNALEWCLNSVDDSGDPGGVLVCQHVTRVH
jgi:hypothetical protein